ncbi:neuropeptide receptor 15-like [Haliotis cracherodii]|uniref:neuropeptide receptor 15-like n=1 Tax=Haliotis cracherodii TaxID=6455 RepID=UPI0039ECF012
MNITEFENLTVTLNESITNTSIDNTPHSGGAGLPEVVCFSVLFFIIGTVGITGNFLVIYAVVCDRKMRASVTNLLITNLAVADLLIMVFGVPEIIQFMINRGWILDLLACKVNRFVLVMALYASVLTLVSICVERFIGIIHPIKAHILCNRRRIACVVGFIWPFSILCGSPTLLFNTVKRGHPQSTTEYCMLDFPVNHNFYIMVFKYSEFGLFYVMPLVIQCILYAIVSKQLFLGSEKLHRRLTVLDENGTAKERTSEALQARKGVVKMLIMSVIVYFISYSPNQVLLFYHTFNARHFEDNWTFQVFVVIIAYVNSAANPILYSIFSQNFRNRFNMAVCYIRRKVKKSSPRRQSTFSTSSRFGRLTSLVPSANTDL